MRNVRFLTHVLLVALSLSLAACGGGGGGGGGSSSGGSGLVGVGTGTGGGTGGTGTGGGSGGTGTGGGSGGSGSGGGSSGGTAVAPAQLGPSLGQALLGPIVGATVEVYDAEDFDGVVVCTVTTSAANATEGPGVINLSACPISVSSVYFLVVHGGMDIDANDDKVIDATPTAKTGSLRAIISGRSIRDGDFRVNIVTEIAYQGLADALLSGADKLEILDRLDGLAKQLLSDDLNGDGIVDNEDLVAFSPVEDTGAVADAYAELLSDILAAILSGNRHELTVLSRKLLLASLGEHDFRQLLNKDGAYQALLIHDFVVEDDFVYAVGYDTGSAANDLQVFVLDATDFSAVSLVGKYSNASLPVNPQNATLELLKNGDLLYVTSQGNGLFVIDVSDPARPSGALHLEGSQVTSMAIGDNDTMYVGWFDPTGSSMGISVVDIADPKNPVLVGPLPVSMPVFGLLYVEGMLYAYGPGIAAFDASSPRNPVLLDTVSFPTSSDRTIVYRNGFIYVPITDTDAGLQGMTIVDVRDPRDLRRIHDVSGTGFITEIDLHDGTLYATASTAFGSSYTVNAFEIGADGMLELIDSRSTPMALRVRYENGRVYLASTIQLTAYDANALNNRVEHFAFLATDKSANHLEVAGGVAYVANDTELMAIDVSNPAGGLPILDRVSVIDIINGVEIANGYAYLANGTEGIKIVDVRNPRDLKVLGSNDELNPFVVNGQTGYQETFAIAVKGDLAYTVVGGFPDVKLGVFNIADPMAPTVVHSVPFAYPLGALVINNNTAYGVDTFGGASFYVLDIESAPKYLTTQSMFASAFELDGVYLYTTSRTAGLRILNVASERNPIQFGSALSLGIGHAVSVVGEVAYVANDFGMVEIYDVLDRTKPVLAGQFPMGGVVKDVFATDEYVYAVNSLGLVIEPAAHLHDALE